MLNPERTSETRDRLLLKILNAIGKEPYSPVRHMMPPDKTIMAQLTDPQAAQQALLVMYAEDMYDVLTDKGNLTPPVDSRVAAGWNVIGFITAVDAVLDTQQLGAGQRCY